VLQETPPSTQVRSDTSWILQDCVFNSAPSFPWVDAFPQAVLEGPSDDDGITYEEGTGSLPVWPATWVD